MANSLSKQIVAALRARLEGISVAAGFNTDAGSVVRHGRLKADSRSLHLAILSGASTESQDAARQRVNCRLTVEIAACIPTTPEDVGEDVEDVVEDIQRAIEVDTGRSLGGIASDVAPLGRGRAVPVDGTANEYTWLTYLVSYIRGYGQPQKKTT